MGVDSHRRHGPAGACAAVPGGGARGAALALGGSRGLLEEAHSGGRGVGWVHHPPALSVTAFSGGKVPPV